VTERYVSVPTTFSDP